MFKLYMRSMRWGIHNPWKWFFLNIASYAVTLYGWRAYAAHVERKDERYYLATEARRNLERPGTWLK